MTIDPRTPVLIGTGQVVQRANGLDDASDPVALMVEAIKNAADDAGLGSVPSPQAIRVVSLLSWKYKDPAHLIAQDLGLSPQETALSSMGGNTPQTLVNTAARQIAAGQLDLVILTGGEATRTRARFRKAGIEPNWRTSDHEPVLASEDLTMNMPAELDRKIMMPIQIYPMFETALRAQAQRSVQDHQIFISELWSRFSAVASTNPYAWTRTAFSADEIRTPSAQNRMIGFPYTKYMNSNNDVDMAAALILCSAEKATALGVPRDRWIFPQSGSDAHEHPFVSNRNHFYDTPAIKIAGKRVLELAGLSINDIDLVDLYSCFPAAVQLGAQSLGLDINSQLTRTGGLPFAGGPWNNYVMHAIATLATQLRQGQGSTGLIWANGGYTTKHSFGVYSTSPPTKQYAYDYPQDEIDALPGRILATPTQAVGPVTVEAYSVMHDRNGDPERSIISCLLDDGRRAWADTTDVAIGRDMCLNEWVGKSIRIDQSGTLLV